MSDLQLAEIIERAVREDLGAGDVTTEACVHWGQEGTATLTAQADGVLSGTDVAQPLVQHVCGLKGQTCTVDLVKQDGDALKPGDVVLKLAGHLQSILIAERVLLNFLQRLSGIATTTRRYVDAIAGTEARVLDTRKTTPGLRALEKAAVVHGGGVNHRIGLFDGILIKDNHIAAAGKLSRAVAYARGSSHLLKVEVECETIDQVDEALDAGADILLLDNMPPETLLNVVGLVREHAYADALPAGLKADAEVAEALETMWREDGARGTRPLLEASGDITLSNVRAVAETGVDFISIGAITHSAPILPMHLEIT